MESTRDQGWSPKLAGSNSPVIALTGAFGSGLTTAARHMQTAHNYLHIQISEEIRKEWNDRIGEQPPAPSDMQRLGDDLRQNLGNGELARRAVACTSETERHGTVIESIKNVGEIRELRKVFGYRLLIVAILSDYGTRSARTLTKYESFGLDENHLREDDLRDRNEEVAYGQQVELCIDLADVIITNNDDCDLQTFYTKVDDLLGLVAGTKPRTLTQTEIYMHAAYSIARSSKCIKRHVGAVLVDSAQRLVAAGFNENPAGTLPCIEEPRYSNECHRDIVRRRHFSMLSRKRALCPVCKQPLSVSDGPPWRCDNCYQAGRKTNLEQFFFPDRAMSWCTAVHAEVNAILVAGERARESTLYSTTFPCMQCAEKIIEARIEKVVYTEAYPDEYGVERLAIAGINVCQFEGVRSSAVERLFPNSWIPQE